MRSFAGFIDGRIGAAIFLTLALCLHAHAESGEESFRTQVKPLLQAKCFGCHGDGQQIESRFDMRTREGVLRGGEIGPGAVAGKPEESAIYLSVLRQGELVMPPQERNRLKDEEIVALRRWIEQGLPWSTRQEADDENWSSADGVRIATSGGLNASWTNRRYQPEDVWAFFPVKKVDLPQPILSGQAAEHPVDVFIAHKLRELQLPAVGPADRRTWIRRATFDLTGLPPTLAESEEFLNDKVPGAFARVIDRLLASPHYGERMAQHWLDVVRYADTAGFANDWERPHAWRYRDYVIRSFHADKPYDRFVIEQIAGDELPGDDPELQVAVGYLRMGPWEHTSMSVASVTRQQFLDDVTNSIGETFLGLGMSCCQCHDHKFDPLPTRDYYRLQAALASTQFYQSPAPLTAVERGDDAQRREEESKRATAGVEWLRAVGEDRGAVRRVRNKHNEYLKLAAERFAPVAFSVKAEGNPTVRILRGGSLESPGEEATPGVLSAFGLAASSSRGLDDFANLPTEPTGRRLALARWIADPQHPLTARVLVNRVWQMHFGTGLVATPNTFGKMGARPSHPELLDWLAGWFVEHGWSIKELHRLIMTSQTYQRSSQPLDPALLEQTDPQNRFLAYFPPRRLSAEEIRDAMLSVSGELSLDRGGPGVFPEINWEVAKQPRHIMGGVAPVYQSSPKKRDRNRRTIYAFRCRTLANPMLEVLNRPGPDSSCARRDETTVTPQVFALFNSKTTQQRSLAMAERLERLSDDRAAQIHHAFLLALGRQPSAAEWVACQKHLEAMTAQLAQSAPGRLELPPMVKREMIDEQSGEMFYWEERLHSYADYEYGLTPSEAAPLTRVLAELCLVLLNTNEFVYVY